MTLTFETNRLTLRPFELTDAKMVQLLAGSEEVASTTLSIPYPYPDGVAEKWIEAVRQSIEKGENYAFAIVKKEDGALIGNMSMGVSLKHKRAELAYWIGKPFWGQGYATEAAKRIVQFGFEDLGLNRIQAAAMTRNPASYKVMIKIGMKYEGTFPQHVLKQENFEDLVYYGMMKSDYTNPSS
ncbi:Protein N-acetyltransferase, RimJ/RimL family [Paenibacillus sp. UNCCL117]|uniref:GNAT family N-acetyltransferase n=1 Tax=unclassified Paenibacillus TaxID=185978 RepID=UPI0008833153|nr:MULTISPECIES: GNAT family N-acetyltransferase [unclassified Paenibacillus]SDD17331.1 Protein N-acetyltransferase, RimJ/RimL family [Paenibacillus sp. cl123]SFW34950.1 Protein N-acetyltransferase, RimJ/RimL family [Paenibacillus sp. UNCCL117]